MCSYLLLFAPIFVPVFFLFTERFKYLKDNRNYMEIKYKIYTKKIGDSYYILIPNDFIKFNQINVNKEIDVTLNEVEQK